MSNTTSLALRHPTSLEGKPSRSRKALENVGRFAAVAGLVAAGAPVAAGFVALATATMTPRWRRVLAGVAVFYGAVFLLTGAVSMGLAAAGVVGLVLLKPRRDV